MNLPKIIETGVAATLRQFAKTPVPRVRTWQNVSKDARWIATNDRVFPLVDIRASPAKMDENGHTFIVAVAVLVATSANDDKTHEALSSYYEDCQDTLDSLYSEFLSGSVGPYRTAFDKAIADAYPQEAGKINVGGFTHGDPLAPYEDGGANFIGINFNVHCSRQEY